MKKYLYLTPFLFLVACSGRDVITTAHDLEVRLVGTDSAYCVLSTKANRYALVAPDSTLVERDRDDLKVDCRDNLSDRRRTLIVESRFSLGYWSYPEYVTVNFASAASETIDEGGRVEPEEMMVKEVLTEDSYSSPIDEEPKLEMSTFDSSISQDIAVETAPTDLIFENEIEQLKEIEAHSLGKIYKQYPHLQNNGRKSYSIPLK